MLWRLPDPQSNPQPAALLRCRGEIKAAAPLHRDSWMTATPEVKAPTPAYMAQKSVQAFSQQGVGAAAPDASWTALPGAAPAHLLTAGGAATVQPLSKKEAIAQQNAELMRLVADESAAAALAEQVRSTTAWGGQRGYGRTCGVPPLCGVTRNEWHVKASATQRLARSDNCGSIVS